MRLNNLLTSTTDPLLTFYKYLILYVQGLSFSLTFLQGEALFCNKSKLIFTFMFKTHKILYLKKFPTPYYKCLDFQKVHYSKLYTSHFVTKDIYRS